jgi:hypothetical protein
MIVAIAALPPSTAPTRRLAPLFAAVDEEAVKGMKEMLNERTIYGRFSAAAPFAGRLWLE